MNLFKLRKLKATGASHIVVLMLVVVGSGILGTYFLLQSHANAVRVKNAPVVFVHGAAVGSCPTVYPGSFFNAEVSVLRNMGYTGPADYVTYYACDSGGTNIMPSAGKTAAPFAGGAFAGTNGVRGDATDNTDIRNISYHLAWYIYNKYSSHGQTVEMVGHSMGGLITAWMLYRIQAHDPAYPPSLYVQDAVTVSSPYGGLSGTAASNASWCPQSVQCSEFLKTSSFITELQAHGIAAQATNGTDWTAIGGGACDTIAQYPPGTTTAVGHAMHVVIYYAKSPVCYTHINYLSDTSMNTDDPIAFHSTASSTLRYANYYHPLAEIARAIMSGTE